MTPGKAVITWRSVYNYQGDRAVPQLPILKSGFHYRIYAHIISQPADSYLVRLSFFNLQGTEIKRIEFRSQQKDFVFPTDAVSYQIDIINAGLQALEFDRLDICAANMPKKVHNDIWVHKPTNGGSTLPPNIIIIKDGKQARKTYPQLVENASWLPVQVISISWQYDDDFAGWLKHWLTEQQFDHFHIVSTNSKLDEMIWNVHKDFKNSETLLADVHNGKFTSDQVWNYSPQIWQSPNICEPNWYKITQTMKDIWGRELVDHA